MKGRYRRKSRAQAQQEIAFTQKDFKGGERSDIPASDIASDEVALLENAIAFPEYIEGRSGSQRFSDTALPGSGDISRIKFLAGSKKWILVRNGAVYVGNTAATTWTQVTYESMSSNSVTEAGDASNQLSNIAIAGMDASNSNVGVLYWNLTNSGTTRTLSLYKDSAKLNLVGVATRTGDGSANINASNSSGLIGTVTITYSGDDTDSGNTITQSLGNLNLDVFGSDLTVEEYGSGAVAIGNRIYFIHLTRCVAWLMNPREPFFPLIGSGSQGSGTPYGYRLLYTYSRIEDTSGAPSFSGDRVTASLAWEGPSNKTGGQSTPSEMLKDYAEFWVANPISGSSALQFYPTITGAINGLNVLFYSQGTLPGGAATHISIYRTLDIGAAGVDPVSGAGNNPELYTWVGDYPIGTSSISISKTDADIRASFYAGFGLRTRFWEALPSAMNVGVVTDGFLYCAARGADRIYYSQRGNPETVGSYHPVYQFLKVDDGVQAIVKSPNMITILCSGRTYTSSPNSYFNAGTIETIFVLNHLAVADESIGVADYATVSTIEFGTFIALCSDRTVRIWNGSSWGRDLSGQKVGKIVRRMVAVGSSVGCYIAGAYYLWYRTDSTQVYNNLCLRYGFGRDAGYGWSRVAGSDWIYSPNYFGPNRIYDGNGVQRLIVLDYSSTALYWIETFDGFTGSSLSKVYTDKVTTAGVAGTAIVGRVKFGEYVGPEEANTLYHQETHAYVRPSNGTSFPAAFAISMIGYADGSATATETVTSLGQKGDWQFWTMLEGRRLQIELNFATSGWQMTGRDSHVIAQDKAAVGIGPADTVDATYQGELASSLKHWLTRSDADLNRATGTNYTLAGTAPTQVSGPDGKTYGLSFVTGASYTMLDTTSYSDFAVVFWIKGMTVANRILQITGSNSFYLTLTNNTTLSVNGDGNVTLSTVASGWHQIAAVRSGSTVTVYQNGASVGTATVATARGGASVTINPDAVAMQIYDLRINSDDISAGAVLYNYTDITSFSGAKTLPSV